LDSSVLVSQENLWGATGMCSARLFGLVLGGHRLHRLERGHDYSRTIIARDLTRPLPDVVVWLK